MVFQKSFSEQIETSDESRPNAQLNIKNPLDKDIFINGIEIIPEAEFSKKGKVIIEINEVVVFNENQSESFFGYAKFPIPLNKKLKRGGYVSITAWNGTDTNLIKCRFNLSMSENPEPFQSQAVPLDRNSFNDVVSQSEIIIPQATYKNETITKLIDLQGYRRFWCIISAQNYISPILYDNGSFSNPDNSIDADVLTYAEKQTTPPPVSFVSQTFDFESIATRNLHVIAKLLLATSIDETVAVGVIRILTKQNLGDSWTEIFSHSDSVTFSTGISKVYSLDTVINDTFRYVKVEVERSTGTSPGASVREQIFEVYDDDLFGGTVSIEFQLLDDSSGQWYTIIPSSEFGTLSQGQNVSVQIGDTLTKRYALPSTQTNFRAKVVVTGGGLNTGISIMKVA